MHALAAATKFMLKLCSPNSGATAKATRRGCSRVDAVLLQRRSQHRNSALQYCCESSVIACERLEAFCYQIILCYLDVLGLLSATLEEPFLKPMRKHQQADLRVLCDFGFRFSPRLHALMFPSPPPYFHDLFSEQISTISLGRRCGASSRAYR
jgi:hypothetical protein